MNRLDELSARIAAREARIGVIGLGYVGLPLALGFSGRRRCRASSSTARR
jgi:UDP-N-acetyl-D-glucosamine dehydrogenase